MKMFTNEFVLKWQIKFIMFQNESLCYFESGRLMESLRQIFLHQYTYSVTKIENILEDKENILEEEKL